MGDRSRSLEFILNSQGSSPSPPGSLLFPVAGTQTLPRLRPCREAPGSPTTMNVTSRSKWVGEPDKISRYFFCGPILESNGYHSELQKSCKCEKRFHPS